MVLSVRTVLCARLPILGAIGLLAAAGCSGYKPNDGGDALIGTWFVQISPATDGDMTDTVTFTASGTYKAVHSQINLASLGFSDHVGCTETITDTGTFRDDGSTLTILSNLSASGVVTDTGCLNASDNGTYSSDPLWMTGTVHYSATATTLTLVDPGGGADPTTLTRQ
jgi:hypothetical protein